MVISVGYRENSIKATQFRKFATRVLHEYIQKGYVLNDDRFKQGRKFDDAYGLIVKKGKYGGTYAHKDIAFEFGSAISVPFKLYLITEFQRLKEDEQKQIGWTAKRELAKLNYHIHTDAII